MKSCKTPLKHPDGKIKPCGNRVLSFVDPQPEDQCYACYKKVEDAQPPFGKNHGYEDRNDGSVPK